MYRKGIIAGIFLLLLFVSLSAAADEPVDYSRLTWRKLDYRYQAREAPIFVSNADFYYREHFDEVTSSVRKINKILDKTKVNHPEVTVCTYFVESSRSYMITKEITGPSRAYNYVEENLHTDKIDRLKIASVNDLCSLFWTTDHHWNSKGIYRAYTDVLSLLGSPDEPAVPKEEHVFPFIFNGSNAKALKKPISEENFSVYLYDGIPSYTSYINGKAKQHDSMNAYLEGRYATDTYTDHYSAYYGSPNLGEVIYDTGHPEREDIIVITNSYGYPVSQLLTLHYNKVVVINLKYYKNDMKKAFDLDACIDAYNVSQILILGDVCLYWYPGTF